MGQHVREIVSQNLNLIWHYPVLAISLYGCTHVIFIQKKVEFKALDWILDWSPDELWARIWSIGPSISTEIVIVISPFNQGCINFGTSICIVKIPTSFQKHKTTPSNTLYLPHLLPHLFHTITMYSMGIQIQIKILNWLKKS